MRYETCLEPVWNGTLEHDGLAPGLSCYGAGSSLHHSANWERLDALEHGECKTDVPTRRKPGAGRTMGTKNGEHYPAALELLRKGLSYGAVARQLGCSANVPRQVARLHGIDRSWASSYRGHRKGSA